MRPCRPDSRVRAACAHRHAKALRGADGDVGAHLAGGFEYGERQQVGCQNQRRALGLDCLADGLQSVIQPLLAGYCCKAAK